MAQVLGKLLRLLPGGSTDSEQVFNKYKLLSLPSIVGKGSDSVISLGYF